MFENLSYFFLTVLVALASVLGNSLFKFGLKKTAVESLRPDYLLKNFFSVAFQPAIFAGLTVYAIGAIIWLRVLSAEPLNKSYPALMSLVILFLVLNSIFFLKEPLTVARVAGMVFIILGTFLVFKI